MVKIRFMATIFSLSVGPLSEIFKLLSFIDIINLSQSNKILRKSVETRAYHHIFERMDIIGKPINGVLLQRLIYDNYICKCCEKFDYGMSSIIYEGPEFENSFGICCDCVDHMIYPVEEWIIGKKICTNRLFSKSLCKTLETINNHTSMIINKFYPKKQLYNDESNYHNGLFHIDDITFDNYSVYNNDHVCNYIRQLTTFTKHEL